MEIHIEPEVIRLPLWKSCLDDMLTEGVNYGSTYSAAFFEDKLKCLRDSMQFGLDISEIRRELEKQGMYISGRGQKGNQFVILPASSNARQMECYQSQAIDALKRGVILGTNTRLDLLSDIERRKHERVLERMAVRSALIKHTAKVVRVLHKHQPDALTA